MQHFGVFVHGFYLATSQKNHTPIKRCLRILGPSLINGITTDRGTTFSMCIQPARRIAGLSLLAARGYPINFFFAGFSRSHLMLFALACVMLCCLYMLRFYLESMSVQWGECVPHMHLFGSIGLGPNPPTCRGERGRGGSNRVQHPSDRKTIAAQKYK